MTSTPSQRAVETQWIAGLRAGQVEAFDALYLVLVPALYGFARRFVPADSAEDIVQDVMIDLWDRRSTVVIQGTLRGYLYGAVRRRIADRYRHDEVRANAAAQIIMADDSVPAIGTSFLRPDQAAETNELYAAVESALATLPPRSKLIVTMRWIDGLSYPEIAEILGLSIDAAKKQGRRMEQLLRPLLARFAPP